MPFTLSSSAFVSGGDIPLVFTCDGENVPPHLNWSAAPPGARSFALIMDDPDAPAGPFTHWVGFDIPANRSDMPSGRPSDAIGVSGRNSRGQVGYMGPCPPSGTHRYYFRLFAFRLFALDVPSLSLKAGASRQQVEETIARHTVGTAELMGRYSRRK